MNYDAKYCPESECRWKSYGTYILLVWAWMMNEVNLMYTTTDMATHAFYLYGLLFCVSVVTVGIPMVYSEICIAQFSNCTIITVWNFFPLFRSVAYGTIYLIFLKIIHNLVIGSYYLNYDFYAALDPPPWFSCNDFNSSKCMVKRVNISVFQHCLEADAVFKIDCGMQTASGHFFEREIGDNNTSKSFSCLIQWKFLLISLCINFVLFILLIKKYRVVQICVRMQLILMAVLLVSLFLAVLSISGSWYSSKILVNLSKYNFYSAFKTFKEGFLSLGVGTGMFMYLSRDVTFRSPAAMTAVATSILSAFFCMIFSLIAFNGIKAMSYYHGEETSVIEIGSSILFDYFATMSEILMYFNAQSLWTEAWYLMISYCILMNLWLMYLFLGDLIIESNCTAKQYQNVTRFLLLLLMSLISWPFNCSDLVSAVYDAVEIIQLMNSFLFSVSLYWIYGIRKHSVDIIFMIGVKVSLFWQICWMINPIMIIIMVYVKWHRLTILYFSDSYVIISGNRRSRLSLDLLVFYILVSIYLLIVFGGMIVQSIYYYRFEGLRDLINADTKWGPSDKILFKSRQMFVPQLMTTEFLYRQIRIHGLTRHRKQTNTKNIKVLSEEPSEEKMEWSVLTSN